METCNHVSMGYSCFVVKLVVHKGLGCFFYYLKVVLDTTKLTTKQQN